MTFVADEVVIRFELRVAPDDPSGSSAGRILSRIGTSVPGFPETGEYKPAPAPALDQAIGGPATFSRSSGRPEKAERGRLSRALPQRGRRSG